MILRSIIVFLAASLLAGCAGEMVYREGMNLLADGKTEAGLAKLEEAVRENPENLHFRMNLQTQRNAIIYRLLTSASNENTAGGLDDAEKIYRRILALDPANERAAAGLDSIARERRHRPILDKATVLVGKGDAEGALAVLRPIEAESPDNPELLGLKRKIDELQAKQELTAPTLKASNGKPISLEFRDANLKIVFETLSRSAGVNFILDKDVKPDLRTTIFLRQASLEDAIELLLQTNHLEKKVLNRNTVLIYPNTPEKQKDYQELVVKGFYLANADVKQTQAMLKGLLKTRDIFIEEKLNLLVMRDTPEAVRMAERLIAMQDLREPEVMLEVEIMEIKRSRLLELGLQWPNQLTLAPLASGSALTLYDLNHLNSSRTGAAISNTIVNLRREITDANILANPRIRARNREKAKIMIGDKVPVITTTSTATGFVSQSTQYLDVGLKLEVEPTISLENEVAIRIGLEVSSIVKEIPSANGSLNYQIGNRNASTVLRLRDGETQVLAGLINDEDRSNASRVPGLGDVPILGRLFGSQKDDRQKTEIVLSITPHIVRNLIRPDARNGEFWSGTETLLRSRPLRIAEASGASAPMVVAGISSDRGPSGNATSSASPPVPPGSSFLSLRWQGPTEAKVGQQLTVSVLASTERPVRSLPFQLGFDPATFQVVGVKEGGFFAQDGGTANMSSQIDPNGKVFVGVARSGSDGVRGDGVVATVTLRAIAAKPNSELRLISVTPVAAGALSMQAQLPAPHIVTVRP